MKGPAVVKIDARGRVAIGSLVKKNSVEPSLYWTVTFGQYGAVTLTPIRFQKAISE